jgi:prevent-host-death family protein
LFVEVSVEDRVFREGIADGGKTEKGLKKDYHAESHVDRLRISSMRYSSQVKPISYLKANAAEVLEHLADRREPMVITQNGEAKAVLQDLASFEETQETLALLKILALGQQDVEAGRVRPAAGVVARLLAKRAAA